MRVLIPCAGEAQRWNGEAKHLIELDAGPLLHRTVRQVNEAAPDADVIVVVKDDDPRYRVEGARTELANLNPDLGDVDKFASSRHLWDTDDWTYVLFGDVWWSEPAMRLVFPPPPDTWTAYARFVGRTGGEIFGFAFHPSSYTHVDNAITCIVDHPRGKNVRGGWALYRYLAGGNVLHHANLGHYVDIDVHDWTDDMDYPSERDTWLKRWTKATAAEREYQGAAA